MKNFVGIVILLSITALATSCKNEDSIDYRQEMRKFVVGISQNAKSQNPAFQIIPQNGVDLICTDNNPYGSLASEYISAIDGQGQEDLFFGYSRDDKPTPSKATNQLKSYLSRLKENGKVILATDYCYSQTNIEQSKQLNLANGFISFQATSRNLDVIPETPIQNENSDAITNLGQVKNFLYLINPENFPTKRDFIEAVCATNYDLIIMDLFHEDNEFSANEIEQLHQKANGGRRMVIAYMSIGEAEDYRYYWNASWKRGNPSWLDKENPKWKGNYKVKYWDPDWQKIIYGNNKSYLSRIINAGFDGVYLDIIDAFEYYES